MDADSTRRRAGQLDSLRALCVLAVLFSHTIDDDYRIGEYAFFEFGAYGVTMFFVLSGYLISGQLLVTRDIRLARGDAIVEPLLRFYAKRVLRLFPAFYLAIALAALLDLPNIRHEYLWHVLQLSDILFALDQHAQDSSAAGHLWSLTVEWQFYALWPLVILTLPPRRLLWAIAALALAGVYAWAPLFGIDAFVARTNILQSVDSLAFGAALALIEHRGWRPARRLAGPVIAGAGAVLAASVLAPMTGHGRVGEWLAMPGHEAMNLLFAATVYGAARGFAGRTGRLLDLAPLRYIGLVSYGIYIYHQFILALLERMALRAGWGELPWGAGLTALLFALSTIVAGLSWRYVERPINGLRRGLAYPPAPSAGPAGDVAGAMR